MFFHNKKKFGDKDYKLNVDACNFLCDEDN